MSDSAVTFEKVRDIISATLKVDAAQITEGTSFVDDLKADSLDLVELIMAFEDEYGVEIPDEDSQAIQTVGAAVKYIEARLGSE